LRSPGPQPDFNGLFAVEKGGEEREGREGRGPQGRQERKGKGRERRGAFPHFFLQFNHWVQN